MDTSAVLECFEGRTEYRTVMRVFQARAKSSVQSLTPVKGSVLASVAHTGQPSIWEAEAEGSGVEFSLSLATLQMRGEPELHEMLCQQQQTPPPHPSLPPNNLQTNKTGSGGTRQSPDSSDNLRPCFSPGAISFLSSALMHRAPFLYQLSPRPKKTHQCPETQPAGRRPLWNVGGGSRSCP